MLTAVAATAILYVQPLHHRKIPPRCVLSVGRSGENCLGQAPDSMVGYQEVFLSAHELYPDTCAA